MLRYALNHATSGTIVTFDPALDGQSIALDTSGPQNHISIGTDVMIQGLGSNRLTISGGGATRIFLISVCSVQISGLTLANGLAKGGDGAIGAGGAGGGGGAAGMGGAIFLDGGSLVLNGVELKGNLAVGGNGGKAGSGFGAGNGGAGGACSALPRERSRLDCVAGRGGAIDNATGGEGGWGAGGGGGGFIVEGGRGKGGSGGSAGFGGGPGGAGGYLDLEGNSSAATGGSGGSGYGGAVFVSSGFLQLFNTTFVSNGTARGVGGIGATNGDAKGGALFVCAPFLCGEGHDGAAIWFGDTSFRTSIAADAGADQRCPGQDDADVCGPLGASTPTHFSVLAPPSVASGAPFNLTVKALDANNNLVFTYAGSVHLTCSDKNAVLPADGALFDGKAAFPAILRTAGGQTITVTDATIASLSGTSNQVMVDDVDNSTATTEFAANVPRRK